MAEFKGLDAIQKQLLEEVSGLHEMPEGAYSLRINGALFGKNSSAHIRIEKKTDKPGLDIRIRPGTMLRALISILSRAQRTKASTFRSCWLRRG